MSCDAERDQGEDHQNGEWALTEMGAYSGGYDILSPTFTVASCVRQIDTQQANMHASLRKSLCMDTVIVQHSSKLSAFGSLKMNYVL